MCFVMLNLKGEGRGFSFTFSLFRYGLYNDIDLLIKLFEIFIISFILCKFIMVFWKNLGIIKMLRKY